MAKREESKNTKSKMTVVMFQLEGSDTALLEGIRTISNALTGFVKPTKLLLANSPQTAQSNEGVQIVANEDEEVLPTENQETLNEENGAPKPKKSFKTPVVLDLDLISGKVPLEQYCTQKGLDKSASESKKYLVIAAWLKDQLKIEAVSQDHIHTCLLHLGWDTPKDASLPLRQMKQKGWFHKAEGKGAYKLNHIGDNEVRNMVAKA